MIVQWLSSLPMLSAIPIELDFDLFNLLLITISIAITIPSPIKGVLTTPSCRVVFSSLNALSHSVDNDERQQ